MAIGRMSVWPSTRIAQSMSGGILRLELASARRRACRAGRWPSGVSVGRAGVEQHFGLEHEAVADHAGCPCGLSSSSVAGRRSRSDSAASSCTCWASATLSRCAEIGDACAWLSLSFASDGIERFAARRRSAAAAPTSCWFNRSTLASASLEMLLLRFELAAERVGAYPRRLASCRRHRRVARSGARSRCP